MDVLGISGLYHDAAAALIRDGEIVAAAQEERFTRVKGDASFPENAIAWCLREADVATDGIAAVAYYDKPLTTFVRVLKSYVAAGPRGLASIHRAMPEWLRRKLWISYSIEKSLRSLGYDAPSRPYFAEHHVSHAAAAFYPSPFERAAILTFDGVGEWATSSIGVGHGRRIELLAEMRFPDSLGLLYSAFTSHAGFRVNSGEYKLMGLAPFGEPVYRDRILDELIDLAPDGSFRMNLRYFDYLAGRRMTNRRFDALFDGPARDPDGPITQRDRDLAASAQDVVTEVVLRMARHAADLTGESRAVLAGGVALNAVANGRLAQEGIFEDIWIQPAAGDAGSAIGCALWAWHEVLGNDRRADGSHDGMSGAYLGPWYPADDIERELSAAQRPYERFADRRDRDRRIAALIDDGNVVGVFQGRMEFGPRALGHRSIVADPRSPTMQRVLNERIKRRESFRPFAPAVLAEHAGEWFELAGDSPYMLIVSAVSGHERADADATGSVYDALAGVRSTLPAVTHVDGSARIQTVDHERAPDFWGILQAFYERTSCPVLVNTSFNVRGEPIACTPEDAYRCFMTTDMDWLVLEDLLLDRRRQPPYTGEAAPLRPD